MSVLESISHFREIRALSFEKLNVLCNELRWFIVEALSKGEGHLGSSLGVVELTVALYHIFNLEEDRLIWDVGHQAYPHKILSGRKEQFSTNRKKGGISGFPSIAESEHDHFGTGHSSTAISAITGMLLADNLLGRLAHHIAVIGDASIVSGMAIEGLNHAGSLGLPILIVLNDNNIGIDPSVGAIKEHLNTLQQGEKNWFTTMNFDYRGPIDGHNIVELVDALNKYKSKPTPTILHIKTIKGKGIKEAENNQVVWHAPGRFDAKTGKLFAQEHEGYTKYQEVFGQTMVEIATQNQRIAAITPAMPTGSSLNGFMNRFPTRAIDVGIAEQHALTLAAGMSTRGIIPYVVIYSTFLQRAYDQLVHDIALQNLPVVICIDRAGLVGHDGATHQGVFDVGFSRTVPNLTIWNPMDEYELRQALFDAQYTTTPIIIRYPRGYGKLKHWKHNFGHKVSPVKWKKKKDRKVVVVSTGTISSYTITPKVDHVHLFQIKPIGGDFFSALLEYRTIIVIEENSEMGGLGEYIAAQLLKMRFKGSFYTRAIPDRFIHHSSQTQQREELGLDQEHINQWIEGLLCCG